MEGSPTCSLFDACRACSSHLCCEDPCSCPARACPPCDLGDSCHGVLGRFHACAWSPCQDSCFCPYHAFADEMVPLFGDHEVTLTY